MGLGLEWLMHRCVESRAEPQTRRIWGRTPKLSQGWKGPGGCCFLSL